MDFSGANELLQLQETIERAITRVNTCIPGIVQAFDASNQTCTVQPAIRKQFNINGEKTTVEMPIITNAPIVFPFASTAGYALTLPVKAGDSCLILFSQRAIDNWWESGGIQDPENAVNSRHHSLTDALVLLAPSNIPNKISGWNEDGIELRNTTGTMKISISADGIVVESEETVTMNATSVKINCDVIVDGDVSASSVTSGAFRGI